MRTTPILLLLALLSTGCIASVGDGPAEHAKALVWEYKQDHLCVAGHVPYTEHDAQLAALLEQRGREGWELVSVNPSSSGTETCYLLIFKRAAM